MQSALSQQIEEIIAPTLNHLGFEVVRIQWLDVHKRRTLQIMADRLDGQDITVDNCAQISHTISALLDVDDPIEGAYDLEVSSPGIDRPLVRQKDFANYAGHEVKIEMQRPIEGRKRYRGELRGISEDAQIQLFMDNQMIELPWRDLQAAKLVLTDKLIEQAQQKQQQQETLEPKEGM
jgi:ribosome maturation factor RimP